MQAPPGSDWIGGGAPRGATRGFGRIRSSRHRRTASATTNGSVGSTTSMSRLPSQGNNDTASVAGRAVAGVAAANPSASASSGSDPIVEVTDATRPLLLSALQSRIRGAMLRETAGPEIRLPAAFNDCTSAALFDALAQDVIHVGTHDNDGVRRVLWRGVEHGPLRPYAWRAVLHYPQSGASASSSSPLGYVASFDRRLQQYRGYVQTFFDPRSKDGSAERLPQEQTILVQLAKDLPRHHLSLYHHRPIVSRVERLLFIWSVRHPATGYVQAFDDIMVAFFTTFLTERIAVAMARCRLYRRHRLALVYGGSGGKAATWARHGEAGGLCVEEGCDDEGERMLASLRADAVEELSEELPAHTPPLAYATRGADMAAHASLSLWSTAQNVACTQGGAAGVPSLSTALQDFGVTEDELDRAEVDTYYCGGQLLEWVQHHYVHGTPGINAAIGHIETLFRQVKPDFAAYLIDEIFIAPSSFLYAWVHTFLLRFLPAKLAPRLVDTFLAIGPSFPRFHVYLCTALLASFEDVAMGRPMELVLSLLQQPTVRDTACASADLMDGLPRIEPTASWLDTLLADAYLLQLKFPDAAQHLEDRPQ